MTELAGEFLEVSNEAELDRFLGDLIKKAGSALGKVVRSPVGQAVGGLLKGAAKQALPLAGAALGGAVGGPLGAQIGSGLASAAGDALGLESAAEDREFEGAKNFVKMAGDTVKSPVTRWAELRGSPLSRSTAKNGYRFAETAATSASSASSSASTQPRGMRRVMKTMRLRWSSDGQRASHEGG